MFMLQLAGIYVCLVFIFGFIVKPVAAMTIGILAKILLYDWIYFIYIFAFVSLYWEIVTFAKIVLQLSLLLWIINIEICIRLIVGAGLTLIKSKI